MELVGAFFLGGTICAVAEVVRRICKLDAGTVVALCIVFGVLLTATGLIVPLLKVGDAGVIVMVVDCGEAIFASLDQLFAADHDRIVRFLRDMGVIVGAGMLAGVIRGIKAGGRRRGRCAQEGDGTP